MKLLSISADRECFNRDSASFHRQQAYGALFDQLDIVVFTRGADFPVVDIAANTTAMPTSSCCRVMAMWDAVRIGLRRLKAPGPWIITTQDPAESGMVGALLSLLTGVPLHVQIHTDIFCSAYKHHSLMNYARFLVAKWVLSRARSVRVVSERIKQSLVRQLGFAPNVISILPIFTPRRAPESERHFSVKAQFPGFDRYLLCVSRLESEKRISLAIECCAELVRRSTNPCLVIVGCGSQEAQLQKLARQLGVASRVFFCGRQQNVGAYYATSDVLLVPSHYEGFGMVLLEAAYANLPIVSTDVGIAGELGARVVAPNSTAFADAVQNMATPVHYTTPPYVVNNWEEYLAKYRTAIVGDGQRPRSSEATKDL